MSVNRNPQQKWARVRRAERLFLRWAAPSAPLSDLESEAVVACRITPEAEQELRLLLDCKGRWQGGPLFGLRVGGELRIQLARAGQPRGLQPIPSVIEDDPYALDAAYLLGMSDMLEPAQLDWCGHWIAAPDSLVPDDLTTWADAGLERGLVDDEHPVIMVGHDRDGLSYWALIRDVETGTWREPAVLRP